MLHSEIEVWHQLQATPSFPPLFGKGKVPAGPAGKGAGAWVRGGGWPRRWRGSQADLTLSPAGTPRWGSQAVPGSGDMAALLGKVIKLGGPKASAQSCFPAPVVSADPLGLPPLSLEQALQRTVRTGRLGVCFPVRATHTQKPAGHHWPTQGSLTQPRGATGLPPPRDGSALTACTDCSHFRSLNQSENAVPRLHGPHVASSCHTGRSRHRACPWCPFGGPGMALPSAHSPAHLRSLPAA